MIYRYQLSSHFFLFSFINLLSFLRINNNNNCNKEKKKVSKQ